MSKRIGEKFARTGVIDLDIRKHIQAELDGVAKDAADFEKKWRAAFDKVGEDVKRVTADVDKNNSIPDTMRRMIHDFQEAEHHIESFDMIWKMFGQDVERNAARVKSGMRGASTETKNFGDKIGKFFGAGSRNDFLNIFGKIIGTISEFGFAVGNVAGKGVESLIQAFSGAEGAGSGMASMFGEIAGRGGCRRRPGRHPARDRSPDRRDHRPRWRAGGAGRVAGVRRLRRYPGPGRRVRRAGRCGHRGAIAGLQGVQGRAAADERHCTT